MLDRLRNLWRPEGFHYQHRLGRPGRGHFEGWYLKLVDPDGAQPRALIPGVFLGEDAHAFLQVLDGRAGKAAYHRFPLESFRAEPGRFEVAIARSRFGEQGISLDVEAGESSAGQALAGEIEFGPWRRWPVTRASPGVMGPYSFVPFMECKHGILSLDHELRGRLVVDGRETVYDGGRGYVEKDWGRRFPSGYVWTQSNHFDEAGVCVTASVARIPWLTGAFRGFLVGLLRGGELHRFTTYGGGRIESLALGDTHLALRVRNRTHRLEIDARKSEGGILHAPYDHGMLERVAETMTSEIELRLCELSGRVVYEGRGRHACLETQGDLAGVLDA